MAWTWKKTLLVAGGTLAGGVAIAVTAGAAAPAIGMLIGSGMGLSGAAATSAGLAAVGGGALAAGGAGVAGGTSILIATGAAAGAVGGAVASGVAAAGLDDPRRCKSCKGLLDRATRFCPHCGKEA
jgi:hypothetical protein